MLACAKRTVRVQGLRVEIWGLKGRCLAQLEGGAKQEGMQGEGPGVVSLVSRC